MPGCSVSLRGRVHNPLHPFSGNGKHTPQSMCPPLEATVFHAPFSQPAQAPVRDARLPSSLAASLFATVFPGLLGVPEGKHRPILLPLYR